jgi:hypothetical protein
MNSQETTPSARGGQQATEPIIPFARADGFGDTGRVLNPNLENRNPKQTQNPNAPNDGGRKTMSKFQMTSTK